MNERIREITGQVLDELVPETWVALGYDKIKEIQRRTAELIVRECAKVAVFKDSGTVATADVAGHMAAGRSIAASLIKEHFGVEE